MPHLVDVTDMTHIARRSPRMFCLYMHEYRVVYELIMPREQVASKHNHPTATTIFCTLCVCAGPPDEPFWHV